MRFSTSKTSLTVSAMGKRSPLGRVRILLSSSTVFKLSIHSVSTGPSQTIQYFLFYFYLELYISHSLEKTPGVHSSVTDFFPYIYVSVIALGFIITWKHLYLSNSSEASISTALIVDLPTPDLPTSMNPCLTRTVS